MDVFIVEIFFYSFSDMGYFVGFRHAMRLGGDTCGQSDLPSTVYIWLWLGAKEHSEEFYLKAFVVCTFTECA